MEEVEGSNPSSSTLEIDREHDRVGFSLAGLVAAEGIFSVSRLSRTRRDGTPLQRFIFAVSMATRDRALLETLQRFLGAGSLCDRAPRDPRWLPITTFTINGRRTHHEVTIPFAERFLLPSAKRLQFEQWREALVAYESAHPSRWGKGPSICRTPGCDRPVRGQGLCRVHYYRETGW